MKKDLLIKGTGVDIIEIARVKRAFKSSGRFAERIYTPGELVSCGGGIKPQWGSLAARFAAKEAVAKALGTGFGPIRWTEIEIVRGIDGSPEVVLHGNAVEVAGRLGIQSLTLSLSHSREYAIAFVVAS